MESRERAHTTTLTTPSLLGLGPKDLSTFLPLSYQLPGPDPANYSRWPHFLLVAVGVLTLACALSPLSTSSNRSRTGYLQ